jgi:phosphomevalonate kinase
MTTALCGALLHTLGCVDLLATNDKPRIDEYYRCIHNVAQLAHAIAQGKVGSGFDVSSAVYGTQIYQRFDPENINRAFDMLNALDSSPGPNAAASKQIFELLNDESVWTQRCMRFQLPPGLDIVLGDVCGGSSSSSMVNSQYVYPYF